jgi:hypothetical protein
MHIGSAIINLLNPVKKTKFYLSNVNSMITTIFKEKSNTTSQIDGTCRQSPKLPDSSKAILYYPMKEVVATKLLQVLQEQENQSKMTMIERERWREKGSITIL